MLNSSTDAIATYATAEILWESGRLFFSDETGDTLHTKEISRTSSRRGMQRSTGLVSRIVGIH